MKKHTPAPWKIKKSSLENYDVVCKYGVPVCLNATRPNAQLISAAPELLEICKKSLTLLCTSYDNGVAKIKLDNAGHIISMLKNAIEKSEGN